MIVYLAVLGIFFLGAIIGRHHQSQSNLKFGGAMLVLYGLMAMKAPLQGDYSRYATHFLSASYKSIKDMASVKGEIGFHAFTKWMVTISDHPSVYFAVTSAFICIAIGIYIKRNCHNKMYGLYFYYTIGLFAFTFAGLRQALAMSICLFGYEMIIRKKPVRFLLIVAFAFLFHKSAILFVLAYPIAWMKWKWNRLMLMAFGYGVFCVLFGWLYQRVATWLGYDNYGMENTGNGWIFFGVLIVITALSLIYRQKLLEINPNNLVFINLNIAVLGIWVFRLFTRTVERPAFFYIYSTIIVLEQIMSIRYEDVKKKRGQQLLILCSLVLFGLLFLYRLRRDGNLLPYVSILKENP